MRSTTIIRITAAATVAALGGVASAQCLNSKMLPSAPAAGEFNFTSGDISGDRVVLGRNAVDVSGQFDQGRAQFFIRQGLDWVSDGLVTGTDSSGGDRFGTAVSIKGTRAAIGAPFHFLSGVGGNSHGAAYIFDWFLFGGWSQSQKLTDPTPVSQERFGEAIAVDGNWVVVGAPYKTIGGVNFTGAACFFQNVSGTWTFRQQSAVPSGAGPSDNFGAAVDLIGDVAIVGAPRRTVSGTSDAGTAYIYRRSGTVWNLESTLLPQVISTSGEFGGSVCIIGDLAVVGARLSTVGPNNSAGIVTIFRRSGGSWVREQTIPNPTPATVSFFGTSVSLSGNRCTITSSLPERVYVYQEISGVWTLVETQTDPDGGSGQFGYFVAADGHQTLIGDPADDTIVANNGAAYVYTAEENGSDSCDSPRAIGFGEWIGCNMDATTDGPAGCAPSGKDVWYSQLVDCTGWYQVDTQGSNFDTVLSVYEGVSCPGTLVACDDDGGTGTSSLVQFFAVKGQYLKIRVAGYGSSPASGTFILKTTRLAPFNDDCASALNVTEGAYPFGTCLATTDGFGEPPCVFFGDNQVNQDVWYTYTASCTGQTTVSLCGSDFDTKLNVYSGAGCPLLIQNPIACADDSCGTSSLVTFSALAGQSYKIRVGGFGAATGSGVMTITNTPSCPGDADGVSPVGLGDLAVIINHWNMSVTGCNNGDVSGDGAVGLDDVVVVINNWTAACP